MSPGPQKPVNESPHRVHLLLPSAMAPARHSILIADVPASIRHLAAALKDGVVIIAAESWGEAVSAFHEEAPDAIVVSYHFDQLRPFRLIQYVRAQGGHVPIILVRALALHLRAENEADIRDAYKELGVDEFVSLYDEEQRHGREAALKMFRQAVRRRLPA
jgi:PleD family two-component response regulator